MHAEHMQTQSSHQWKDSQDLLLALRVPPPCQAKLERHGTKPCVALRLCYNNLHDLTPAFCTVLNNMTHGFAEKLRWVDLSFNHLSSVAVSGLTLPHGHGGQGPVSPVCLTAA